MFDIVIIGAGVVGALCAEAVSGRGASVCVLEAMSDASMGASGANSGIVHAGFDAMPGTLKAEFNVKGAQMMPKLCERLGVKYKNNGSLVIGFDGDLPHIQKLYKRGMQNGVKNLSILDSAALHALEPAVSGKAVCALSATGAGIVCPYSLTFAALGVAMDNGAELKYDFKVDRIERINNFYRIYCGDEYADAGYVINSAGVYSDFIAGLVGDRDFTVTPRKGEYVLLDRDCGGVVSHTVFVTPSKMGKGILVSPTADGNLILGPTSVDTNDKNGRRTTAAGITDVLNGARRSIPSVPNTAITSFTGIRAVGSTGDFIIKQSAESFLTLAGIESPGLTSSPAIAEYVKKLLDSAGVLGDEIPNRITSRRPAHFFKELTNEEKNACIAGNPAYGKIVCRCEEITEGEIIDALRTNPRPRTLDAVKRRVRAGMGRCQGGFCSPTVMRLISEELDIPYEKVTKCGGKSYMTVGRTKKGSL